MEFYKETRLKDSGIGKIPSEWNESTLGLECDIIMGQSPPSNTYNEEGKGIPFFQGNFDFGDLHPKIRLYCSDPKKIAEPNDILVSVRAPVGALNIAEIKCCIGRGLAAIRTNNKHNRNYIYFILQHFVNSLVGQGSTFKAVGKDDLTEFVIPVPPFKEEQRIASILSSLEALMQKTDVIIKKTQELKKGLMQELLTKGMGHKEFKYSEELGCEIPSDWNILKIEDVADTSSGGTPSRNEKAYFYGSIPWLKSGELKDNYIYDSEEKISEKGLTHSAAKIFPIGTLLIAMYGATVGKTGILRKESATNQAICAVLPKEKNSLDLAFVQNYIIFLRDQLVSISTGGAQPNISQEIIRNTKIPFPPYNEQIKIASILSNVDRNKSEEMQTKSLLIKLKEGLMQILLTGQVRIKVD